MIGRSPAKLLPALRSRLSQDDVPGVEEVDFETLMDRRKAWLDAPVELRTAVTMALVRRSIARARRRRRRIVVAAVVAGVVPVVAAGTATTWPGVWVVYAVAMSVALGSCAMTGVAPYQPAGQLFDRGAWLGPVTPKLLHRLATAEEGAAIHPAEMTPAPSAAPHFGDALADLTALGDLSGQLATAEPWRTLTAPYLDAVSPGLAAATHALAATPRYAQRPLRESASVTRRTYARAGS